MEEQRRLFKIIKSGISNNQRLSDIVEALLNINQNAAYRRIRGETELTFSELLKISSKFNLSIDEILHYKSTSVALFHYNPLKISDQESYFN